MKQFQNKKLEPSDAVIRGTGEVNPMLLNSLPPPHKRLYLGDSFNFSCHKGLACFGTCCRNRDLTITPYDVLRLKNALKLHSDDFLSRYTFYRLDAPSGFPVITLKMRQDSKRTCPLLTSEGCSVYRDRPTACRLFPLARASGVLENYTKRDEFFFLMDAPNCLGRHEEKTQNLKEWLDEQGLGTYRIVNDKMLGLLFHPDRKRGEPLDDRQLQKIMIACYNLDIFREFVFETKFLDSYLVDDQTRSLIKHDDFELLMLGFAYLRTSLFS
jgi:Fe-S-cluster containining protein